MIFLNAMALVSYCRNAGNPYLSEKSKKYVRKFKVVLVIWNLAFIVKFIMSSAGSTILDIKSTDAENNDDFWYSLE